MYRRSQATLHKTDKDIVNIVSKNAQACDTRFARPVNVEMVDTTLVASTCDVSLGFTCKLVVCFFMLNVVCVTTP